MDGFPRAKKMKEDLDVEHKDGEVEKPVLIEKSATKEPLSAQNDTKMLAYSSSSCLRHESAESTVTSQKETIPSIIEGLAPSISDDLLDIEQRQCSQLLEIKYPAPVTHVYNPLSYAGQTHRSFVHRYGNNKKRILFVGMNPGPFGMAQNGVRKIILSMENLMAICHNLCNSPLMFTVEFLYKDSSLILKDCVENCILFNYRKSV